MVSIRTDLSALSGIRQSSTQAAGRTINKKTGTTYSVKNETFQFASQIKTDTRLNLNDQSAIFHFNRLSSQDKASLLYNGKPISQLSVEEASDLISTDGYFGVDKTSQRIIDFVMRGAGDDIDRLRAGREGILRGFAEAEKLWGGKLPDISYDTLAKSLEAIDEKIREMGGSVVDLST